MTAKTSETLALALEDAGLPDLAAKARADEYHDYLSPHALPQLMLVTDLRLAIEESKGDMSKILDLQAAVIDGVHDASAEESDEWASSEEGQASFREFIGKAKLP